MAIGQRERRIYRIKDYPEEVIATAIAKSSRSSDPFDKTLEDLSDAKAAQFHEKWVVGYGHASVAEHAVLRMAFEGVTRLAADELEANRLASFTEKSTRFNKWGQGDYHTPQSVVESKHAKEYEDVHTELLQTYGTILIAVGDEIKRRYPAREGESDEKHDGRVRTTYVDRCRFILPASSLADLGMTANARTWEYAIKKWLSSNLTEVREIGEAAKEQALLVVPTLVKYARASDFITGKQTKLDNLNNGIESYSTENKPGVKLFDIDQRGEDKVLAALLYQARGSEGLEECMQSVGQMTREQKINLLDNFYGQMSNFDKLGREFELANFTFDVTLDWASYRDFWRNRMLTQIAQTMTGNLEFAIPKIINEVGMRDKVRDALQGAIDLANVMKPWCQNDEYQYLYPNATLRRELMHFNFREFAEFWRIRGAANTNPAYRILALRMGEIVAEKYPILWNCVKSKGEVPTSVEVNEEFYGTDS